MKKLILLLLICLLNVNIFSQLPIEYQLRMDSIDRSSEHDIYVITKDYLLPLKGKVLDVPMEVCNNKGNCHLDYSKIKKFIITDMSAMIFIRKLDGSTIDYYNGNNFIDYDCLIYNSHVNQDIYEIINNKKIEVRRTGFDIESEYITRLNEDRKFKPIYKIDKNGNAEIYFRFFVGK